MKTRKRTVRRTMRRHDVDFEFGLYISVVVRYPVYYSSTRRTPRSQPLRLSAACTPGDSCLCR